MHWLCLFYGSVSHCGLIEVHGGRGGAGGCGGQQGGVGGKGAGGQVTFYDTSILSNIYIFIYGPADEKNKILDWLTTINFFQHQNAIFETWQEGTGKWFLSLPEFKTWLSNSEKVLWCEGPPGAGKTVLSSLVIKHIEDHFQSSKVGLAYIYINHKELGNQSPTALFASLCKQLLLDKPLPLMLHDLWKYHDLRNTQPTINNVMKVLEIVLLEYSSIYLVIDALDEYFTVSDERRGLLIRTLAKVSNQFPVHLMITTRADPMSMEYFPTPQVVHIKAKQSDLCLYVENQFKNFANLFQIFRDKPQLRKDIQLAIVKHIGGTFLLAKLHMDYLGAQPNIAGVQEALKTLSSRLDTAYGITMARINSQADGLQKLAHRALMWITNAQRPLSAAELCQAIAIDNGDTCLKREKISEIEMIMSTCAGLVVLDYDESVVRLIHYTTQEWLEQYFENSHKQIASTCFQYLAFSDFEDMEQIRPNLLGQQYPLAVYAQHCLEHIGRTKQCGMEMIDQVEQFANTINKWRTIWRVLPQSSGQDFWRLGPWYDDKEVIGTLSLAAAGNLKTMTEHSLKTGRVDLTERRWALSVAVHEGYVGIVEILLKSNSIKPDWGLDLAIQEEHVKILRMLLVAGADINNVGGEHGTALQAAVHQRSQLIVKMLLHARADMNIVSGKHGTALQAAAHWESEPIVKMLLDAGADMNIVGGRYGTALHAAVHWNSERILKMLLNAGADMNIVGGEYGTVLHAAVHAAVHRNSRHIVKMLLDAGADMNIVGGEYGTVLHAAVHWNSGHIVKMLLDAGAHMNIVGGKYGTALQAAVYNRSQPIVKMLLDAGADMNIVAGKHGTALHVATYVKSEVILRMLLDAGADVNIVDGQYGTALQAAVYNRSQPIVKMLLDAGADMNIVAGKHGTALHAATYVKSEVILRMLLDAGADVNIVDGQYGTALHAAAFMESERIVKMLLAAGADMSIVDAKYGTVLHIATYVKSEHILSMLLNAGADMNIVGGKHGTALQTAAYWQSESIVKMLIDRGAGINIVGGKYGTTLQTAAYFVSERIVKMLLNAGADVNIVGGKYGTALQAAAHQRSECIITMLLYARADLNIVSGKHGTALQAAAYWESESIVKMLLDRGAGINIVGGKYGTALQTAAYFESEPIVKMLLDAGADVNIVGGKYGTALQAAAYGTSECIVKMLLDRGADIDIVSGQYGTALQASLAWNDLESNPKASSSLTVESDSRAMSDSMVKLLLEARTDANLKGENYGSALKAAKVMSKQAIKILTQKLQFHNVLVSFLGPANLLCCLNSVSQQVRSKVLK
ncbi:ANK-REP-region domain-containing protein [Favolaschia claudopus]|uniref:ANK-REP-region domain-containing protein n=1 Tax=Favolaschia claudopus TaxID=2862362 RepID=A0AAW0DMA5_9AGAR